MDGGRSVESAISAAIVSKNGTSWPAKHRTEFQILYDEDAASSGVEACSTWWRGCTSSRRAHSI